MPITLNNDNNDYSYIVNSDSQVSRILAITCVFEGALWAIGISGIAFGCLSHPGIRDGHHHGVVTGICHREVAWSQCVVLGSLPMPKPLLLPAGLKKKVREGIRSRRGPHSPRRERSPWGGCRRHRARAGPREGLGQAGWLRGKHLMEHGPVITRGLDRVRVSAGPDGCGKSTSWNMEGTCGPMALRRHGSVTRQRARLPFTPARGAFRRSSGPSAARAC